MPHWRKSQVDVPTERASRNATGPVTPIHFPACITQRPGAGSQVVSEDDYSAGVRQLTHLFLRRANHRVVLDDGLLEDGHRGGLLGRFLGRLLDRGGRPAQRLRHRVVVDRLRLRRVLSVWGALVFGRYLGLHWLRVVVEFCLWVKLVVRVCGTCIERTWISWINVCGIRNFVRQV